MVFDLGDSVTGWGRLVVDADGPWLDLARVSNLEWSDPPRPRRRSRLSVRLVGADVEAVATGFGPDNAVPGCGTVCGVWRGDVIEVRSQSPAGPPPRATPEWTTPPCPPPVGGWSHSAPADNLDLDLGDLQTSGAAVAVTIFRPGPTQAVLVVAAADVDAVAAILRPQLPDRLCVVASRWTRSQLDEVRGYFVGNLREWGVELVSDQVDHRAQPSIRVDLLRVTPALAEWAAALPDGLLELAPYLTPVPAETPVPVERDALDRPLRPSMHSAQRNCQTRIPDRRMTDAIRPGVPVSPRRPSGGGPRPVPRDGRRGG